MNNASIAGRLTKDPEIRYTSEGQKAVAHFTVAVDRYTKGGEKTADFIRCVAFDRIAETLEKYVHKGDQAIVTGSIRTGSYQKDSGETVYTTDVYVREFNFGQKASGEGSGGSRKEDFEEVDEEVPF